MYCSQCGTPIHDKSKFCYKCGARVLTVPGPEEGQDAEAGERQPSRGSEGRERRGGRSSEKDPESGADGAGSARAAAPAVKPAPVKAPQAKAPAAKPQKSAAPAKKAQADAPKQLPYEKSAGVIRDLLRMLPREMFDGDDDRLRMLDDGVRICSSVADGSYDGSFFRLALDFTDNIVIRKQDESEAPGRSEHSFTLTFGTDGGDLTETVSGWNTGLDSGPHVKTYASFSALEDYSFDAQEGRQWVQKVMAGFTSGHGYDSMDLSLESD